MDCRGLIKGDTRILDHSSYIYIYTHIHMCMYIYIYTYMRTIRGLYGVLMACALVFKAEVCR